LTDLDSDRLDVSDEPDRVRHRIGESLGKDIGRQFWIGFSWF